MVDGWKFIETDLPKPQEELYHIATDPKEENNLAGDRSGIASKLRRQLKTFLEELPSAKGRHDDLTEEEKTELRALGYLK